MSAAQLNQRRQQRHLLQSTSKTFRDTDKAETESEKRKWEEGTRRGETQENLWSCFVLFPEGSITLVWAHVTLGGKTEKEKIGDAGQAPQAPLSMEHCWTGDKFL